MNAQTIKYLTIAIFTLTLGCAKKEKITIASTVKEYCELSPDIQVTELQEMSDNARIMQLSVLHLPEINIRVAEIKKAPATKYDLSDEELEYAIYTRLVKNMNKHCRNYNNLILNQLMESPPESDALKLMKTKLEKYIAENSSKKKSVRFSKMTDFVSNALYNDANLTSIKVPSEKVNSYLLHHSDSFRNIYFNKMQMQELMLRYNQFGDNFSISF